MLGIGGAVTLAAWNDSEYAGGAVTAGHFTLEGSTDGSNFRSSEPDSPHILPFAPDVELYPGSRAYAPFSVRTAEGSVGGTVQVLASEGNGDGLGNFLTYGIRQIEGTTCTAEAFNGGANVVPRGTALTVGADDAQALPANQGATVNYCLELQLPEGAPNEAQGLTATPEWQFFGTSVVSE